MRHAVTTGARGCCARGLQFAGIVRVVLSALLLAILGAVTSAQQQASSAPVLARAVTPATGESADARAIEEMLRGTSGRDRRWATRPHLVVLTTVMAFTEGPRTDYTATAVSLSPADVRWLVKDLTAGLALLSGGTLDAFASVRFETPDAGTAVRVVRDGEIVVARFRGVRDILDAVGYGGRTTRKDGTITSGTVMLDEEYDRGDQRRHLLRMHELGHALGYNHVESQRSIMNATLGAEPTDFDRKVARIAFSHFAPATPRHVLARN